MAGRLYIVSTPIGNLEDITYRAVRILGEVAWIACEDTRHTRHLLDRYAIRTPMISYHEHNEAERAAQLVAQLERGENGALVSDAGTPLVSDPGFRLVQAAAAAGIVVEAVPGASALLAALVASALPTDAFRFVGFLPSKQGARVRELESLRGEQVTLVFYEAPHRVLETLRDLETVFGTRRLAVARELTKVHEEVLRGTAAEIREQLAARDSVRGEFVIVADRAPAAPPDESPVADAVAVKVSAGMDRMDAIKAVARERGLSKREVYSRVLESSGEGA